ncbi:pentatricopeptide repeat-containing protein, mitochondrial-like protein [Salvia divinorum]|uniref:Pentatricopeptide repeat-containing protein, mitochondrial-like protein n=1 Tax=Salvia divinorum TaxID=28513 RepID=A0ABD1FKD7_SALDI
MKFLIRFPSSRLRFSAIASKSLSSSSLTTPLPNWVESSSILEPQTTSKTQTFPKPISQNAEFSDKNAVDALLSHKNDPQTALEYANWAGETARLS